MPKYYGQDYNSKTRTTSPVDRVALHKSFEDEHPERNQLLQDLVDRMNLVLASVRDARTMDASDVNYEDSDGDRTNVGDALDDLLAISTEAYDYVIDDAGDYVTDSDGNKLIVRTPTAHSDIVDDEPLRHLDNERSELTGTEIDIQGDGTRYKSISGSNTFTFVNPKQNRTIVIELTAAAGTTVTLPATVTVVKGYFVESVVNWLWINCVDEDTPAYLVAWNQEIV